MRKQAYLAALAAVTLVSCQQEQSFRGGSADRNEIAFTLQGAETRSEGVSPEKQGVSIPLGTVNDLNLFLEETIVDLDSNAPETRGTPVYTENVGYLYKDQLGVHTDAAGGVDASFARLDDKPSADGWAYQHRYDVNIWEDETTDVQFYLYMPANMTANGVSNLSYNAGVVTASYTSPTTAAAQQDIIFGGIKMNHKQYLGHYYPQGAPVKLYHALTGIKFAIKNTTAELANIQIHKISFIGLKNTGTLTFTSPRTVAWSNLDVTKVETPVGEGDEATTVQVPNTIYQTYQEGDLVNYDATTHAGNNFANSFFGAGVSQNLNKADASYTFWLIPQGTEDSSATLKIEYTMNGKDETMEIPLTSLHASNWQAGQLRTYTFKLDEVNVKIEDTVTIENPDEQYIGSHKDDVVITNTGNTDCYIRAAIIGQWLDSAGDPVFGFTDFTASTQDEQYVLVDSWYQDQFSETGQHKHGAFKNLPGYKNDTEAGTPGTTVFTSDWWVMGGDGYYYFKYVVPAGKSVPAQDTDTKYLAVSASGTTEKTDGAPLFESYTIKDAPDARVAGKVEDIFFELEIATQAISAKKLDGTYFTMEEAWAKAGITVTE